MLALYAVVVVILLFSVTVFVHELGHFLAASRLGLVIDVFSIGFGPAIWKKKYKGVTYKIGCLPLGGYVALPQLEPGGAEKSEEGEEPRSLPSVAPWKKMVVAVAGAVGNVLFAVFLAFLVYWVGKPSAPHERNCVVGYVSEDCTAYTEGIRIGDEIKSVNDEPVQSWDEFIMKCALLDNVRIVLASPSRAEKIVTVPTSKSAFGVQSVAGIGWVNYCSVASVVPGSSAEKAGLLSGDRIVSFNGVKLYSREHLIALVDRCRDTQAPITVERDGNARTLQVTPAYDEDVDRALIGVVFNTMDMDYDAVVHPTPASQIKSHALVIVRFLRALLTPREARAASRAVGGPIAILFMFWLTVKNSLMVAIWFTGLLNVNLAILNLLPIPVLDGGHIMFALYEAITRKSISPRVANTFINIFATLLIGVFVLLSLRDVRRWILPLFGSRSSPAVVQRTNSVPQE